MIIQTEDLQYIEVLKKTMKTGRIASVKHLTNFLNKVYAEDIKEGRKKKFSIANCTTCIRKNVRNFLNDYQKYIESITEERNDINVITGGTTETIAAEPVEEQPAEEVQEAEPVEEVQKAEPLRRDEHGRWLPRKEEQNDANEK